jgi:hypothetical protein
MLSAIARSVKTSSAATVGFVEVSRHERRPLRPSSSRESFARDASISAAVVPGAKLDAVIVHGPALPFMLKPPGRGEGDATLAGELLLSA